MRADARPRTTSRGRRRRRRSSASSRWPWIANDASARPAPALPAGRRGHPHAHAHETTHRPTHSTHPLVYIERSMFRFPVIKCLNELIQARESTGTRCRRSNSPRMLAICLRRPPLVCVRHWRESSGTECHSVSRDWFPVSFGPPGASPEAGGTGVTVLLAVCGPDRQISRMMHLLSLMTATDGLW